MTSEAILVDITDSVNHDVGKAEVGLGKQGAKNCFYSLPKTLSEDDDPFGLSSLVKPRPQPVDMDDLIMMRDPEPNTGLLVQIDVESPKASEPDNSR